MSREQKIDIGIVNRSAQIIGYVDQIDPTTLANQSDPVNIEGYERISYQFVSTLGGSSTVRVEPKFSIDKTNWFSSGYAEFRPVDGIYTFHTRNFPWVALEVTAIDAAESEILFAWQVTTSRSDYHAEPAATGIMHGGKLSISSDDVIVAKGSGVIVDASTDPLVTTSRNVYWEEETIVGPLTLTNNSIFIFMQANGEVTWKESITDYSDMRNMIYLGSAVYDDTSAPLRVASVPSVAGDASSSYFDMTTSVFSRQAALVKGNSGAGDMSIEISGGKLIRPGINWHTSRTDPNRVSISSGAPVTFDYMYADGSVYSGSSTLISVTEYESGGAGTVSTISGSSQGMIHHVFVGIDDTVRVLYPQTLYTNFQAAVDSLSIDLDTLVVADAFLAENAHVASIIVDQDSTDTSLFTHAKFVDAHRGPFGSPFLLTE